MTDPLKRYDTSEYGGMEPHEDGDWYDKDEADTLIAELRAKIEEDLQIKLDQLAKISRQGREIAELRGEVNGLSKIITDFADYADDSSWPHTAEELRKRMREVLTQPAEVCGECKGKKLVPTMYAPQEHETCNPTPGSKQCPACQGTGQKGET